MLLRNQDLSIWLVFLYLIVESNTWNEFCSVYCKTQQCKSPNTNDCKTNNCNTNGFQWDGATNKCVPQAGWVIVDTSEDIVGGSIGNTFLTTTTCGPGHNSPWGYNYYGNLTGTTKITFTDDTGVSDPHYQIRLIFAIILIDNWPSTNIISVTLNGTQLRTRRNNHTQPR